MNQAVHSIEWKKKRRDFILKNDTIIQAIYPSAHFDNKAHTKGWGKVIVGMARDVFGYSEHTWDGDIFRWIHNDAIELGLIKNTARFKIKPRLQIE